MNQTALELDRIRYSRGGYRVFKNGIVKHNRQEIPLRKTSINCFLKLLEIKDI